MQFCDSLHKRHLQTTIQYQQGHFGIPCHPCGGSIAVIKGFALFNKPITSLGLTLAEFVVTACIAGILAAVAISGFMDVITNNRITSVANHLVTALAYTRSEAIKRGQQIKMKHKDTIVRMLDNVGYLPIATVME